MRHRPVIIKDERRPKVVNLYNLEQRLQKYRTLFALVLGEIDEALAEMRAERERAAKVQHHDEGIAR